jgi:hypothetical protein
MLANVCFDSNGYVGFKESKNLDCDDLGYDLKDYVVS